MAKKDFSGQLGAIARPAPVAASPSPKVAPEPAQLSQVPRPEQPTPSPAAAAPVAAPAPTPVTAVRRTVVALHERMEQAVSEAEQGGMLRERPEFTKEAAIAAGRPLRRHRVMDLVLHPQNPRPISGDTDLDELRADWRKNGQKDPIHIVPFGSGWGIMEGQRRWLVAKYEHTEFLECFEHPSMEPIEVYAFGMSIHRTRKDQTAIDEAKALSALLATGITRAQLIADLVERGGKLSEVDLSRKLAINGVDDKVMRHILGEPKAFSERHLYALARLAEKAGVEKAAALAEEVRSAFKEDNPISAKSIERVLMQIEEGKSERRTRRSSTPKKIRSADGADVGMCRGYVDGKIEFKPDVPLDPKMGEKLHEAVSRTIAEFFEKRQAA